jgi:hypothetical protein
MIYYQNTGAGDIDSITILPRRPSEEKAVLLIPEYEFLQNYDFRNFNYFNFEHSITDMSPNEFEWWYSSIFKPWLINLDEKYLDIDIEGLTSMFDNQEEKRVFLLKIVNFVMFLLPYQILRHVFKILDIEDEATLKEFINDDTNLINLRQEIIDELDRNMTQFDDFIKTLLYFEKVAKKNLVEENIELLDEHVKKQNIFLEIFKEIINETDMHKMKEFIFKMLEMDARNIIS